MAVPHKSRVTPRQRVLSFVLGCIAAAITYALLRVVLAQQSSSTSGVLTADTIGVAAGLAALAVWTLVYLRSIRVRRKD
jgi:hypothetical protein